MPNHLILRAAAVLLLAAAVSVAHAAETARVEMVRSGFAWGAAAQTAQVEVQTAGHALTSPVPTGTEPILFPGLLAPGSDAAGLLTPARVQAMLLGTAAILDPIALDFAGNRDGQVDVADLVLLVRTFVP